MSEGTVCPNRQRCQLPSRAEGEPTDRWWSLSDAIDGSGRDVRWSGSLCPWGAHGKSLVRRDGLQNRRVRGPSASCIPWSGSGIPGHPAAILGGCSKGLPSMVSNLQSRARIRAKRHETSCPRGRPAAGHDSAEGWDHRVSSAPWVPQGQGCVTRRSCSPSWWRARLSS